MELQIRGVSKTYSNGVQRIRAGIDPNYLLLDLDADDNIEEVKIES